MRRLIVVAVCPLAKTHRSRANIMRKTDRGFKFERQREAATNMHGLLGTCRSLYSLR